MSPTDSSPDSNPSSQPPKEKFTRVRGNKNIGHLLTLGFVILVIVGILILYAILT